MRGREESSPQKGEEIKWIAVRTEHQPKSKHLTSQKDQVQAKGAASFVSFGSQNSCK